MEIVKLKIYKIVHQDYFPIIIFGLLILAFHFFVRPSGDDIIYGSIFYNEPFLTFIRGTYDTWSSRIVIMPVAVFFAGDSQY